MPEEVEKNSGLWKQRLLVFVRAPAFERLTILLTIVALFLADVRSLFFDRRADLVVDVILMATALVFLLELVALTLAAKNYAFVSAYFWLDVLALASMPFDIFLLTSGLLPPGFSRRFAALKAGRAARGARTQRVLRIARVAKVTRMSKIGRVGKLFENGLKIWGGTRRSRVLPHDGLHPGEEGQRNDDENKVSEEKQSSELRRKSSHFYAEGRRKGSSWFILTSRRSSTYSQTSDHATSGRSLEGEFHAESKFHFRSQMMMRSRYWLNVHGDDGDKDDDGNCFDADRVATAAGVDGR